MKSVLRELPVSSGFPMLMEGESGVVVLMLNADGDGVIVGMRRNSVNGRKIGSKDEWALNCFKPFHGEVVLSND